MAHERKHWNQVICPYSLRVITYRPVVWRRAFAEVSWWCAKSLRWNCLPQFACRSLTSACQNPGRRAGRQSRSFSRCSNWRICRGGQVGSWSLCPNLDNGSAWSRTPPGLRKRFSRAPLTKRYETRYFKIKTKNGIVCFFLGGEVRFAQIKGLLNSRN